MRKKFVRGNGSWVVLIFVLLGAVLLFGNALPQSLAKAAAKPEPSPAPLTFHREISRILQHNCQTCHRPGAIAPFSLVDYADVVKRASSIKRAVKSGEMPPWKPKAGCGEFDNPRVLSDQDSHALLSWIDSGMAEGSPSDEPTPLPPTDGWTVGKPDVALTPIKPYSLEAKGQDVYRCFVLPFEAKEDLFISGSDAIAGSPSVVHHMILYTDPEGVSPKLAGNDPNQSYDCFGGPAFVNNQIIMAWAPGAVGQLEPEGTAFKLPKGTKLVLQVHYHKDGKPHLDSTQIGLFLSRARVIHQLDSDFVVNTQFLIPPGNEHYDVVADYQVPADMHLVSAAPHMHLLGRQIKMQSVDSRTGQESCMIDIEDWDFSWQNNYRFKQPIALKRGTHLHLSGYFDNSESNPYQPSQPPKPVHYGESTTDEMFLAFITYYFDRTAPQASGPASQQKRNSK